MTDQRLRELLRERVDDVTTRDLTADAWAAAARTRRRRTAGVIAGVIAGVVVAGGVVVTGGSDPDTRPAPPATSPSVSRSADADTTHLDAPVRRGPDVEEESDLPLLADSPLPETIDLTSATSPVPRAVRAVALIQSGSRVVVLTDDGGLYTFDESRLDRVSDRGGNVRTPLSSESLAPDGRHAFFVQNSSLEVYDFAGGGWTKIDTPQWHAESARWVSDTEIYVSAPGLEPDGEGTTYDLEGSASPARIDRAPLWDAPTAHPWGPQRGAARSYFVDRPEGTGMAVVVRLEGKALLLALPDGIDGPDDRVMRFKGCCPVVGWLDPDVVLFESRSTEGARILAWRAGTREVSLVSDLGGSYVRASFADLS